MLAASRPMKLLLAMPQHRAGGGNCPVRRCRTRVTRMYTRLGLSLLGIPFVGVRGASGFLRAGDLLQHPELCLVQASEDLMCIGAHLSKNNKPIL
jgi:hypothetical protein